MRNLSVFAGLLLLPLMALADGFTPKEAEEGVSVSLKWTWPVGDYNSCQISGVPGKGVVSNTSGLSEVTFTAKEKVNVQLDCFNLARQIDGSVRIMKTYSWQDGFKLRPTMEIHYPSLATAGIAYPLNFTIKNADSCKMRWVSEKFPNNFWQELKSIEGYEFSSPGNVAFQTQCTNSSGTFFNEKKIQVVPDYSDKTLKINSFSHGNYEFNRTGLWWSTYNAESCEMTRSDGAYKNPVGTQGIGTLVVDAGYKYTLTCRGNGSTISKTLDVPKVYCNVCTEGGSLPPKLEPTNPTIGCPTCGSATPMRVNNFSAELNTESNTNTADQELSLDINDDGNTDHVKVDPFLNQAEVYLYNTDSQSFDQPIIIFPVFSIEQIDSITYHHSSGQVNITLK